MSSQWPGGCPWDSIPVPRAMPMSAGQEAEALQLSGIPQTLPLALGMFPRAMSNSPERGLSQSGTSRRPAVLPEGDPGRRRWEACRTIWPVQPLPS